MSPTFLTGHSMFLLFPTIQCPSHKLKRASDLPRFPTPAHTYLKCVSELPGNIQSLIKYHKLKIMQSLCLRKAVAMMRSPCLKHVIFKWPSCDIPVSERGGAQSLSEGFLTLISRSSSSVLNFLHGLHQNLGSSQLTPALHSQQLSPNAPDD